MDYEAKAGNSRVVSSSQQDIHQRLIEQVERHRAHPNRAPIADRSIESFELITQWLSEDPDAPVILDSCCGVGQSTAEIASRYPQARVIGIDKSGVRIDKHHAYRNEQQNYLLLRADLNDIWRLMVDAGIKLERHFLLYPTPYPKPGHLQRRWYACNAFPALMALGGILEVRSNWAIYLKECAAALSVYGVTTTAESFVPKQPMTPFERKYRDSGQTLWRLSANLDLRD